FADVWICDGCQGVGDHQQEGTAACVVCGGGDAALSRGDLQAGVDVARVPAVVPAGVRHAGGEDFTAAVCDPSGEDGVDLGVGGELGVAVFGTAVVGDSAVGAVGGGGSVTGFHGRSFGLFGRVGHSGRGRRERERPPVRGGRWFGVCEIGAPPRAGATTGASGWFAWS